MTEKYISCLIPQFVNRDSVEAMLIVWFVYLYSLVLRIVCLFVQFGSVRSFAYLYSLVLWIVLLICTVCLCVMFCLFVQFVSVYCFAYLYSLVHLNSCCLFCGIGVELVSNYCCTVLGWWCWVGVELVLGSYSTGIGFGQICVRRYSGTRSYAVDA